MNDQETILNGGVKLTDQNKESIINSDTWMIKKKLLRYHEDKPSEEEIKYAKNWLSKTDLEAKKKNEKKNRKKCYALLE